MSDLAAVAFVTTGQEWQQRWMEHVRDHGGTRLTDVIAEASTAYDRSWQLVVIDATSALMNPTFVAGVHSRGRGVLAVWNPAEPGTKQRAMDANADELIDCDASALEFVATASELGTRFDQPATGTGRAKRRPAVVATGRRTGQFIAVGGPVGSHPAPVVLGMARTLARRHEAVLVADVDETGASLAQLLDLPPVPNLASGVSAARTGLDVDAELHVADGYYVLGGLAEPSQWAELGVRNILGLVSGFAARFERTIAAVGPVIEHLAGTRYGASRAMLSEADAIVAVGEASPVGLTRLTMWVAELRLIAPTTALYLAAAGAPSDRYRQGQVLDRLSQLGDPEYSVLLPNDDARLSRAEWQGQGLRRGPLLRSVAQLADLISPRKARR